MWQTPKRNAPIDHMCLAFPDLGKWDRRALNTATNDGDAWFRLGRLAYARRVELGLTQQQVADRAKVSINTVGRLESGTPSTRRPASWPKLEAVLEWPQGFFEDFVNGKVLGPPEPADEEGRFTRQRKSDETDIVRDLVRMITLEVAPGTSISKVLELEEQAVKFARERGFKGPSEAPSTSDGVYDGT